VFKILLSNNEKIVQQIIPQGNQSRALQFICWKGWMAIKSLKFPLSQLSPSQYIVSCTLWNYDKTTSYTFYFHLYPICLFCFISILLPSIIANQVFGYTPDTLKFYENGKEKLTNSMHSRTFFWRSYRETYQSRWTNSLFGVRIWY